MTGKQVHIAKSRESLHQLVGKSPRMQKLYEDIQDAARSDISVLILGQTGTGKRLVAEAIHRESTRQKHEMRRCNCAGWQGPLLESELFGHVKGAFTGAVGDRTGLFASADGSTLFLDEIGDCPLETQPKLLLALEEEHFGDCVRRFRPVGYDWNATAKSTNVRLVSATNRLLEQRVQEKQFSDALYRRINAFMIQVPTARELGDDLIMIAQKRLEQLASQYKRKIIGFTSRVSEFILSHEWPDNIAGLENFVFRLLTRAASDPVDGLLDMPDDEMLAINPAIGRSSIAVTGEVPVIVESLPDLAHGVGRVVCDTLISRKKPLDGIMHGSSQCGPLMEVIVEGMALGLQEYLKTDPGILDLQNYGIKGLFAHIGLPLQKKDIKAMFPKVLHERLSAVIKHEQDGNA